VVTLPQAAGRDLAYIMEGALASVCQKPKCTVVLDFSSVRATTLDHLGVLFFYRQKLRSLGGRLVLSGAGAQATAISGSLSRVVRVWPTLEEALSAVARRTGSGRWAALEA